MSEGKKAVAVTETTLALREQLAALEHEQWAGWMRYLFSVSEVWDEGSVEIPAKKVERWTRQMVTPYALLPENEKESDRAEADKVLALLVEAGLIPEAKAS